MSLEQLVGLGEGGWERVVGCLSGSTVGVGGSGGGRGVGSRARGGGGGGRVRGRVGREAQSEFDAEGLPLK